MDDGVGRLLEFLKAEEKRGHLCNHTDTGGLSNQSPLNLGQQRSTCACCTKSGKCQIFLSSILLCLCSGVVESTN